MSEASVPPLPRDLLLCIFIHGFKGTDETFGEFPARLQHILTESIPNASVESLIFPVYETKGELDAAVERFADWLATITVEKEAAHIMDGGAGKARVVLCGHSMGGLLAADTLLAIAQSRVDKTTPLWPHIIACLAFDTPYLGIHPFVFKNSATKAVGYVQTARGLAAGVGAGFGLGAAQAKKEKDAQGKKEGEAIVTPQMPRAETSVPSTPTSGEAPRSGWGRWGPMAAGVGGALLAGAAAGVAYYRRDDVAMGWGWAGDHLRYVQNLWDEVAMKKRLESVMELGVVFRTFYTYLPGKPPAHPQPRTFIILPPAETGYAPHFLQAYNHLASDEVAAHTGMFAAASNDGYYDLGLMTAKAVQEAVERDRSESTEGPST